MGKPVWVFREFVASFFQEKGCAIPPDIVCQLSFDQPLRAAILEPR